MVGCSPPVASSAQVGVFLVLPGGVSRGEARKKRELSTSLFAPCFGLAKILGNV